MHVETADGADGSGGEAACHQGNEQEVVAGKGRMFAFYLGKYPGIQQVADPPDAVMHLFFGEIAVEHLPDVNGRGASVTIPAAGLVHLADECHHIAQNRLDSLTSFRSLGFRRHFKGLDRRFQSTILQSEPPHPEPQNPGPGQHHGKHCRQHKHKGHHLQTCLRRLQAQRLILKYQPGEPKSLRICTVPDIRPAHKDGLLPEQFLPESQSPSVSLLPGEPHTESNIVSSLSRSIAE